MPLKKLLFKPGVNRENTRYTTEGGYYECDKIRFRQGTPEKIGGWVRVSGNTFNGVCRSLWPWATFSGLQYIGVGTSSKYYVTADGVYYDITPEVAIVALTDPFTTTSGSTTVLVTDVAHGRTNGTFVTYSGSTAVGGLTIVGEYQISNESADTYEITVASSATSSATGGGSVTAVYQVNAGFVIQQPLLGWGVGPWGSGTWGVGASNDSTLRVWNHQNFGEDLVYGPKGGPLYYWDSSAGTSTRGVALSGMMGASDVPSSQNNIIISDTSRFVIALGCPDYGSTTLDPMLIRWSDQESAVNWTPAATGQAGSVRLSHGSGIASALQVRQEILV